MVDTKIEMLKSANFKILKNRIDKDNFISICRAASAQREFLSSAVGIKSPTPENTAVGNTTDNNWIESVVKARITD